MIISGDAVCASDLQIFGWIFPCLYTYRTQASNQKSHDAPFPGLDILTLVILLKVAVQLRLRVILEVNVK
jgi:hypothetical protein